MEKEFSDLKDRKRNYQYAHIDLILYPDFSIERAGTMAYIHNSSNKTVGELFLYWDNNLVVLFGTANPYNRVKKILEENGYKTQVGWHN